MPDYTEVLRRAIDALPENNGTARRSVYEKAREALVSQLRAIAPQLKAGEITHQRLVLEDCIRVVEQEKTESLLRGLRTRSRELSDAPEEALTVKKQAGNFASRRKDFLAEVARIVDEDTSRSKEILGSRSEEQDPAPQSIAAHEEENATIPPQVVSDQAIAALNVQNANIPRNLKEEDNANEPIDSPMRVISDIDRKKIKIIEPRATIASEVVDGKVALVDAPADAPPKIENPDDRNARAAALAEISLEMASDVESLKYNIPPRIVGLLERCAEKLSRHKLNWYSLDQSIQAIEGFKKRNYEEDWNDEFRDCVRYLLNGIRELEPLVRPEVQNEIENGEAKSEAIHVSSSAGDAIEIKIISGSISEFAASKDAREVIAEDTLKDLQDASRQLKETADAIESGNAEVTGENSAKKAILGAVKIVYVLATGVASSLIAAKIVSSAAGQRVLETLWRIVEQLLRFI